MTNVAPRRPSSDVGGCDDAQMATAGDAMTEVAAATNRYRGALGWLVSALLVAMALFHLYAAVAMVRADVLRPVHVGFTLSLVFLLFPMARGLRNRLMWWDIVGALLGLATVAYLLGGGAAFWHRHAAPSPSDAFFGFAFLLLVLEACRRTSGWRMVLVIGLFLGYALAGPWLPGPWRHPGHDVSGMTGFFYQTLDGVFGTAVKGSSTLIILFAIYGSFLRHCGDGKWPHAGRFASRPDGPARAVVFNYFLLGGSPGVVAATTNVTSTAFTMLERAGYSRDAGGGLLAASGLGAIMVPPVLGAAAILVAEFLGIGYLDVLLMATIPALVYCLSLLLMVEIDARRFGAREETKTNRQAPVELARKYGFHAVSLSALVALMLLGRSPVEAVLVATMLTYVLSFVHRDTAIGPRKLWSTLEAGSSGVLNVAATCAGAGIIVGVVAMTGLGVRFSAMFVLMAGGSLPLAALSAALFAWILGLALPLIASYIIGAILVAPALVTLGVPEFAAHLFIFYFAVLSQVSPPAGSLPFAVAALTGGHPYRTALHSYKYALPAFVLPFAFVLDPMGVALLLKVPPGVSWAHVAWVTFTVVVGIALLAAGVQKWLLRACTPFERWTLIACGLLVVYPSPWLEAAGFAGVFLLLTWQRRGMRRTAA